MKVKYTQIAILELPRHRRGRAVQRVAVCCSVLQCVAVCCSVLQQGQLPCQTSQRLIESLATFATVHIPGPRTTYK